MEYMEGGNLLAFLRNVKGAGRLANSGDIHLPTVEKLDISYQTALGLEFLSSKKVSHWKSLQLCTWLYFEVFTGKVEIFIGVIFSAFHKTDSPVERKLW